MRILTIKVEILRLGISLFKKKLMSCHKMAFKLQGLYSSIMLEIIKHILKNMPSSCCCFCYRSSTNI